MSPPVSEGDLLYLKPAAQHSVAAKEQFITAKYSERRFVVGAPPHVLQRDLWNAVAHRDLRCFLTGCLNVRSLAATGYRRHWHFWTLLKQGINLAVSLEPLGPACWRWKLVVYNRPVIIPRKTLRGHSIELPGLELHWLLTTNASMFSM